MVLRLQKRFSVLNNVIALLLAIAALVATSHSADLRERQATLKVASELEIMRNGVRSGSLTVPVGRQVQILEESGDRLRISVGGLAEGWVAKDAVELLRPKSVTSTLPAEEVAALRDASPMVASSSSVQPVIGDARNEQQFDEENSAASPSAGNAVKKTENEASSVNPSQSVTEKSYVQITVLEDEAEEIDFGDGPCKGQSVQKAFDCRTQLGRNAEGKDAELKLYAILVNENDGKPYSVNGKMLPPVEIKQLRESSTRSAKDLNTHSALPTRKGNYLADVAANGFGLISKAITQNFWSMAW